MKKWISLLLAAVMLFTCIPTDVRATGETTDQVEIPEAAAPTDTQTGLTESETCTDPVCGEDLLAEESVSLNTVPVLEAPVVEAETAETGVLLTWEAVEYAQSYRVYRKVAKGEWTLLETVTDTYCLDTSAKSGVTVSYTVEACLQVGEELICSQQAKTVSVYMVEVTLKNEADGVALEWAAVEKAAYYRVQRRVPGDSWKTVCKKTTETAYVDTTAKSGCTYQYTVRAYVDGGFTAYNYGLTFVRLVQPEASVSNKAKGVQVTWNEVDGAEGYCVYRKASGGSWKRLSTETDTGYLDKTAESGVKYSYRVRAKKGDILSSNAQSVSILRLAQPTTKATNTAEGISVKWDAIQGAKVYRVYRKLPGGSWKVLADQITDTAYVDTTVKYGETYCYAVAACSGTTRSTYYTSGECIRIEQPKLTVSNYTTGIKTSWNAVDYAESYNVYRKVSGGSWKLISNVTGTDYLDKTAEEGVTYSYRVRSKNGETLSSNKRSVSIQRLAKPDVTVSNIYEGVSVKWSQVEGAESYRVYRKVPGGSWKALKTGLTALSYTDTTAQSAATYQYAVRSYNSTGGSAYASSIQIIRLEQPEATAANKNKGVQITWNEVEGAESYRVYRKESGGSWKRLSTETDTSYMDKTAESGVKYSYRVRAKNGEILSSNKLSVGILRLDSPTVTASNGNKGVIVKWDAVEGAESYRILRKVPDGSWKVLKDGVTELKYTDTTAKSGETYYYAARACAGNVRSSYITTKEVVYLSRPAVSGKTVSTTGVKLQWNAVEGAQEYIVYVKTDDTDWKKLDTVTGTSYTAKKLTFGETYTFGVRAVNDSARSTRSAAVSGKATYPAPEYTLELEPGEGILISWKAVKGAASYRVYRREDGGSWKTLKTTTATSYVDTSGKSGRTYEYAVRAFELEKAGGVSGIRATGQEIVYTKIDPDKPMIALTFDDGPSVYTEEILDQLEKYDARATFFVVGERVSEYASTIQRAHSIGCEIGNHSWSHPDLSTISVSAMKKELEKTDAAIEKITGEVPALLRPPYGGVDADVRANAGKPLIHWSVDTRDWSTRSSSSTINSVLNNARDGSIVLMHDIYSSTKSAAVSLIPTLISKGYQLVTVSEMAAYRGITLEDGTVYYRIS